MRFTSDFYARICGALILAWAAFSFSAAHATTPQTSDQRWASGLLVLCGIAFGLILTPYVTVRPYFRFVRGLQSMTFVDMVVSGTGLLAGLLIALLLVLPISYLPHPFEQYLPIIAALALGYAGALSAAIWKDDLQRLLHLTADTAPAVPSQSFLVDTSILVDGRIAQVVATGFMQGTLLLPQFVLREVQQLADSNDHLTRAKGKRGLEILQQLQQNGRVTVRVIDTDATSAAEVDDKLVALARVQHTALLTNDMNLQHVAELHGVTVLNLNRLADALRVQYLVGDQLAVEIRSEGRERAQGVGYTDDGTMIVVEDARYLIGKTIAATITRVYTTSTGRIIFAQPAERNVGLEARERT